MVGNSPASDGNPALKAGLNAVLIPHLQTWELEHEEVAEDERLQVIERFEDLLLSSRISPYLTRCVWFLRRL